MKVKIGSYPSRLTCDIHKNLMQRRYGFDWPCKQTRFENFIEKLDDFIQICYKPINHFLDKRTQKIKVKIDSWDTWSMDHTLAHIIVPMLKQLKEDKHGAPYVDMTDRPKDLQCYKEPEDYDTDKFHFEAWDWVMDEMIWAFEQKTIDWEDQYYSCLFRMDKGPNDTFAIDREGMKKHQERMSNGFRLFGKYYEGLWD
jgi:hypothetical protein